MINKENNYSKILSKKLLEFKLNKLNQDIGALKKAYPNYSDDLLVSGQYNIDKWIQTMKDIYHQEHLGSNFKQALDNSTKSWNEIEKFDFINWIKFYQSGSHLKYKTAQDKSWYENEDMPGYFIPYTAPAANDTINKNLHSNIDFSDDQKISNNSEKEAVDAAKAKSQQHKKKLISRLDSLEKLLRNTDDLSSEEFDSLMQTIFSLKTKIININKRSSVESFCKDLIVREANILAKNGSYKAASYLYVVADEKVEQKPSASPSAQPKPDVAKPSEPAKTESQPPPASPTAAPPPSPTANVGSPSSTQASGPGLPAGSPPGDAAPPESPAGQPPSQPPTSGLSTSNTNEPLSILEKEMSGGGFTDINLIDDIDSLTVIDTEFDDTKYSDDNSLISFAQAVPPPTPPTPLDDAPKPEPKPKSKPDVPVPTISNKNFDDQLEALLGQVSIEDVVLKIEEICKVFKTREIPRQLAVVDMMLDRLGLASFFPSLSEATNKSLESNNYILSRVENILAQLRGAIKTRDLDLTHEDQVSPAASEIRKNLEEREKAESERKQMRKELEEQALLERAKEKEAPEIEVTEEELEPEEAPVPAAPAPAPVPAPPAPPPTP